MVSTQTRTNSQTDTTYFSDSFDRQWQHSQNKSHRIENGDHSKCLLNSKLLNYYKLPCLAKMSNQSLLDQRIAGIQVGCEQGMSIQ